MNVPAYEQMEPEDLIFLKMEKCGALLSDWFLREKRDMPWRTDPTPYHVYVSEIMLQQTRVDTVRPYYERFIAENPDVRSLSLCPEERLLKLWEGLGYYSRVRNMQKAAQKICEVYGGEFPKEYEKLLTLPGIGAYTAAAISSIAFHEKEAVVDGNVLRVISRIAGLRDNTDLEKTKSRFRSALKSWLLGSGADPSDFNQSLMELGALVCLPNGEPHCSVCPVRAHCEAHLQGTIGEIPVRSPKKARKKREMTVFMIYRGKSLLLIKNSRESLLSGLYALPSCEGAADDEKIRDFLQELGISDPIVRRLPVGRHIFTHIEWLMHGVEVRTEKGAPGLRFYSPEELETEVAVAEAYKKWPFEPMENL